MEDFEKLGAFYLGRPYDLSARQPKPGILLYDARDLVTHAVCVGMTGSGKTGLCITLIEEAAIDGIGSILVDPKGDLANLLLTFPNLAAEEFALWVNEDEARRAGLGVEEYAAKQAQTWKDGLAAWGQTPDRIRRLRESADFAIYTPGSSAGLPVSVLGSLAPPASADDPELLRESAATTASSLLGLLGIEADPLKSREHILLVTILSTAWEKGETLDLPGLIQRIQKPGIARIGILELEAFFPAKERFDLATRMNNLLAAPGFDAWMQGPPLDPGQLLHGPDGKPRVSILSIAHLDDSQRMFFVALLLNQLIGWMRRQSGTTSLRALFYMDEITGYFPPVANPPSKAPLLTLLKQARAFGLGVVLATQNPVDLDYKGLANAGTWFLGRLQTERDKARVLEGLEGAAAAGGASFDRAKTEQILAGLGNRVFLLNNVHDDGPEIFEVRWTLSYLRGPLTRAQIKRLMDPIKQPAQTPAAPPDATELSGKAAAPVPTFANAEWSDHPPLLAPEIPHGYLPFPEATRAGAVAYVPRLLGRAEIAYSSAKYDVETTRKVCLLAELPEGAGSVDWSAASSVDPTEAELSPSPMGGSGSGAGVRFAPLAAAAGQFKSYDRWRKSLVDYLSRDQSLELRRAPTLKLLSKPGETERDFRLRLQQAARERRDAEVDKLRRRYAPKFAALEEKLRRADQAVEREQSQATNQTFQTVLSFGGAILGAFLGRKKASIGNLGRATTAARGVGRAAKESGDVARAKERSASLQTQREELETEFRAETAALQAQFDALAAEELEIIAVKPKKTAIVVDILALAWQPT